ncbi:MAG TPA: hypothetical protein VL463_24440 [Kofleriaceae bacterium]|nr:hypothetical protein [Kofleriaceae bacterium]
MGWLDSLETKIALSVSLMILIAASLTWRLSIAKVPRLRYVAVFLFGLGVFTALAGERVFHQSTDPHYVYQADAWLRGNLAIDPPPEKGDDWAHVETVTLDDNTDVRGRRLSSRPVFRTLGGDEIPLTRVRASKGQTTYMSFPPFPTLIMMPGAILGGRAGNDVVPTLLVAALCLPLLLLTLERLADAGLAQRGRVDQLLLIALFAFGTVFFFSAVQGRVWFTAHVVGVALALLYAYAAIEARNPILAGVALGLAAITRPPMAFMFPLFAFEAWRVAGGLDNWKRDRKAMLRTLARRLVPFAAPVVAIAIAAGVYNMARFGSPGEFGHTYLTVRQQAQIEQYGLFSYHYLGRNLAVALTLLPELLPKSPWVQVSGHGLALWVTTPAFLLLLWPREKNALHRTLWITVAAVALPSLLYQNSGWVQFGYRFSLDYTVFLVLLLAVGGRRFGWPTRALIAIGIAINLFGAITFARSDRYYRVAGDAYGTVVAN